MRLSRARQAAVRPSTGPTTPAVAGKLAAQDCVGLSSRTWQGPFKSTKLTVTEITLLQASTWELNTTFSSTGAPL